MTVAIYCFTGTGNSLAIARDCADHLGETEIIPVLSLKNRTGGILKGDAIGFVFPVYFSRPPYMLRQLVSGLKIDASYTFAIANGGGLIGRAMKLFSNDLASNGNTLNAGFIIRMPGNYQALYDVFSDKTQQSLFAAKNVKVNRIIDIIKHRGNNIPETNLGPIGYLLSHAMFGKTYDNSLTLDRHFHVNDVCTHCGMCEQLCPAGNITQSKTMPRWGGGCTNCFACFHWCPQKAIQYGKKSMKYGRYHNPGISVGDMLNHKQFQK